MEEKVMNLNEDIETIEEIEVDMNENEDTTDAVITEDETPTIIGVVSGCKNLNIRKKPVVNDKNVLCVVPAGTMIIVIDPDKATKEWYKVELENGDTGFCMKQYVSVNE